MDVITSPKVTLLLKQLRKDYSELLFAPNQVSRWSPNEKTVYYNSHDEEGFELLHELSHALLGHNMFQGDLGLIKMEVGAWHYAATVLGPMYQTVIDTAYIEEALASYRQWVSLRSACPVCGATGVQQADLNYLCLGCVITWTTNDARQSAGRRYMQINN